MLRDRIAHFWSSSVRDTESVAALAELHWRMWRCALMGLPYGMIGARRELGQRAHGAALPPQILHAADEAVIEEIVEVIVARFRRSPTTARDYTKALVLTAASLMTARQNAEAA